MIDILLKFSREQLFVAAIVFLLLGTLRQIGIVAWCMVECYRKAGDKKLPYKLLMKRYIGSICALNYFKGIRAIYNISSFLFHIGLIIVPIFLLNHIELWKRSTGISWYHLPQSIANILTVVTIFTALILLGFRVFAKYTRSVNNIMDYVVLLLILLVFITGYIAGKPYNPIPYNATMLVHVLCGDAILISIPFSKLSHSIMYPFIRTASEIGWHFPPNAGWDVIKTLNKEGKV